MITYQIESLTEQLETIKPFFYSHWDEIEQDIERVPLDPQYEMYLKLDEMGQILFATVREHGEIFGYFVGFVSPGLHHRTCITLQMDMMWLHPDLRSEDSLGQVEADMVCMGLLDVVEEEAIRRGAHRMFMGSKLHKDASRLFEARGYMECERYYSHWIRA